MFDHIDLDSVKIIMDFAGHSDLFGADSTVPELQCQGVTALCNILHEHDRQYAYLADEVGMGKTYQALGVISMLLKEKHDAKILIIAPNESVQNNWQKEIKRFYKNNLNTNIEIPELLDVNKCDSIEFIKDYLSKDKKISTITLTRISSFSAVGVKLAQLGGHSDIDSAAIRVRSISDGLFYLTNNALMIQRGTVDSFNAGIICGRFLRKYSPKFDLVVIDEAQNIRNVNNATAFLNAWLGLRRKIEIREKSYAKIEAINEIINSIPSYSLSFPDKQKFLLMSATPAHRSIESLRSQLFYFEKTVKTTLEHKDLEKFLIRRLRTYCGESKYDVREIKTDDVMTTMGVEERMLLALVQSRLAQEGRKNNSTFKIGFLETFESYNPSNSQEEADEDESLSKIKKEFENGGSENKYEKGSAADKVMIDEISKSYERSFHTKDGPPHPKLNYMGKKVKESLDNNTEVIPEKSLVFVRRLASVRELVNNRAAPIYEHSILEYWKEKLDLKDSSLLTIQKCFEEMYGSQIKQDTEQESAEELDSEITDEDYDDNNENKDDNNIVSPFRSWIALKKNKDNKNNTYSSVSRFKKTMLNNKHNAYLFEENYLRTYSTVRHFHDSDYDSFVVSLVTTDLVEEVNRYIEADETRYIYAKNDKKKSSDFRVLCCYIALKVFDPQLADSLATFYKITIPAVLHVPSKQYASVTEVKNALSLARTFSFWNYLPKEWRTKYPWLDLMFNAESFAKREVVKRWIEKYLKSSEAILELLYCYCNRGKKAFSELVCNTILGADNPHGRRIELLLTSENTDLIYRQLIGDEKIDYRYNPTFMNDQSWVVGAVGGNKGNEALIKRFNTPFYPDVIVCTDVLKEGINLHLFCNKVYHYGLAWTPGDLEQRVGRVDRFFSKTYRARARGDREAKICVNYPYMGKSIDEQQLKKVLEFKMAADPLMDSSSSTTKSIDVYALNDTPVQKLAEYIPPENEQTVCPYSGEQFWNKQET